jgi:hypothetical protein
MQLGDLNNLEVIRTEVDLADQELQPVLSIKKLYPTRLLQIRQQSSTRLENWHVVF